MRCASVFLKVMMLAAIFAFAAKSLYSVRSAGPVRFVHELHAQATEQSVGEQVIIQSKSGGREARIKRISPPAPAPVPNPPVRPAVSPPTSARAVQVTRPLPPGDNPSWTVESTYFESREDAEQDAWRKAQEQVVTYLAQMDPDLEWVPPMEFVKKLLTYQHEEAKDFDKIGPMRRVILNLELSPKHRSEILEHDQHHRVEGRLIVVGQILGCLVAGLAALSGYLRLDERTKGFYSLWLRLGAIGFVISVCGLLILLGID